MHLLFIIFISVGIQLRKICLDEGKDSRHFNYLRSDNKQVALKVKVKQYTII